MGCGYTIGCSLVSCLFWWTSLVVEVTFIHASSLQNDMKVLSQLLPGVYTNSQQYLNESGKHMSSARSHFLMRSTFRPADISFLPGSFNVFAEQFHGESRTPYRQRVYSFSVDKNQRALRMKILSFNDDGSTDPKVRSLSSLSRLKRQDLTTQDGCDMFWRRLSRMMFIAATGIECLGTIKGQTVRVSVTITLTPKVIQTQEAWYRVKDGSKLVEIEIPYHLVKVKKYKTKSFKVKNMKSRRELQLQNDLPEDAPIKKTRHKPKKLFFRKQFHTSIGTWAVNSFRGLQDALTSGRVVHYVIDLSECSLPSQVKINRKSFGDKISMFENIKTFDGKKRNFIKFSQKRFLQNKNGAETIAREITVYGNGKVVVKVVTDNHDNRLAPKRYTAYCRLFDYRLGRGGVKLSTDPLKDVNEIETFEMLKSSLKTGKQVRMSVDLSKCSGSPTSEKREIGGEIRGYDFSDSDHGIEFTLSRSYIDFPRADVSEHFLIGRFFSNGDVTFVETSSRHENSVQDNKKQYRCYIKADGLRHNTRNNSIKMFAL
ncbi:uncharacterized protein LOC121388803 [Gigantopelta aegis]|uniref:uncharacterized protein LOC121388803 n=1 Tax=Gigantopelta aegis TaxID=1735272 RepID=UPI001B88B52B|nr:uncharacterized protein LOC121388803 [Gigantopelta aegis]